MKTFRRRAIVAALLAASFSAGAAEAQTKFYARRTLPQASATTNAAKTYTGTWFSNGPATETACSGGKRTITSRPYCGKGVGSDGEGGYSSIETLPDSECDPADKPASSSSTVDCINCTGSLVGPTNTAYGPGTGTISTSGGAGTYIQRSNLTQASARAACEAVGRNQGSRPYRGCNLKPYTSGGVQMLEAEMFSSSTAGAIGTKTVNNGFTMECSGG